VFSYTDSRHSDGIVLYDAKALGLVQHDGDFFKKYYDSFDITVQQAYHTRVFGAFIPWHTPIESHRRVYVTLKRDSPLVKEIRKDYVFKFQSDHNSPSNFYSKVSILKIGETAIFHIYPKKVLRYKYLSKIAILKIKVK
ncbi:MAG: hypothetical protein OEW60_04225, partial [Thiovulaceae bacterium]|nr:hypothetical protein [Sulfurimonadaceae bacterium]